ncbi:MAG: hypothetical protein CSA15_13030 [Candidatus Delongbacteria bacterium]|nr:MAG: hypothetical protein CSA15_13030 [Candidatus Delongbacteria bacterium]
MKKARLPRNKESGFFLGDIDIKKSIVAILILIFTFSLFAGSRVDGFVTDIYGEPISGVEVTIENMPLGEITNTSGYFHFYRMKNGDLTLKFSHIGYVEKKVKVHSGKKDLISLKVKLEDKEYILDEVKFIVDNSDSGVKTIISPRNIEDSKSENIMDLLKSSTNLNINSVNGVNTKISIRGAESNQVTVMLDGIEINSSMDGSVDLRAIPTDIVEKVEIYKGGDLKLSSKAVGGIINIITKESIEPIGFELGYNNKTYFSNRDRWEKSYSDNNNYSLSVSKNSENYGIIFSSSLSDNLNRWSYIDVARANEIIYINNDNIAKNRKNSDFKSFSTFAKIKINTMFSPTLILSSNIKKTGMPGWIGKLYYNSYIENEEYRGSFISKHNSGKFNSKLNLYGSYSEKKIVIDEPVTMFNGITKDFYRNFGLKYDLDYKDYITLYSGFEIKRDGVNSIKLKGDHKRDLASLYAQAEKKYKLPNLDHNLKFFIGGRFEYSSSNKKVEPFYSLGIVYDYRSSLFTIVNKSRYESTYRLPDFSSLFWFDNSGSQGNPNLLPERGVSVENGTYLTFNKYIDLTLSFELFSRNIEDLIVWQKKSNGIYIPINLNGGKIKGFDTGIDISFFDDNLKIKSNFSYLKTKTETNNHATDGKEIVYKPKTNLTINFDYKVDDITLSYRYTRVGETFLTTSNKFPEYPYSLSDLKISLNNIVFGNKLTTSLKLNNMFDEQYQVVYGFPMPGREIELGFKLKF